MKRTLKSAKSRSGCKRCKIKRMKCDEGLPSCRACVAAGAVCPGYAVQLRWSSKHERFPIGSQEATSSSGEGIDRAKVPRLRADALATGPPPVPASMPENYLGPGSHALPSLRLNDTETSTPLSIARSNDIVYGCGSYVPLSDTLSLPLDWEYSMPIPSFDVWSQAATLPAFGGLTADLNFCDVNEWQSPIDARVQTSSAIDDTSPSEDSPDRANQGSSPCQRTSALTQSSLLSTLYRMSVPNRFPSFSKDDLVEYYLGNVCGLYSCFDSDANAFRARVEELCKTSTTVSLSAQSMAVGHLANSYPYMASIGYVKRCQAWKSLQRDLRLHQGGEVSLDQLLLSLLLLGPSSSWHPGPSTSLHYLSIARDLVQRHLQDCATQREQPQIDSFLHDAVIAWEMHMSFVDPVPMMSFPGFGMPSLPEPPQGTITPHPWTGAATELHFVLAEVGRLVRRQRQRSYALHQRHRRTASAITANDDLDSQWAAVLEAYLLSYHTPEKSQVEDYDDDATPVEDLYTAAEAQRCIGLIELYTTFPALFSKTHESSRGFRHLNVMRASVSEDDTLDVQTWPLRFAMSILKTLEPITIASGASRFQPFIFLSCASQLRFPEADSEAEDERSENHDEVLLARYFVESRMSALARKYAQKPLIQSMDIIKEVWARLDACSARAHWMDVAREKEWLGVMS